VATTLELTITGMTCDHCVKAVTTALKDVAGVQDAVVNLEAKTASVTADSVNLEELIAAVAEEGYEAAPR